MRVRCLSFAARHGTRGQRYRYRDLLVRLATNEYVPPLTALEILPLHFSLWSLPPPASTHHLSLRACVSLSLPTAHPNLVRGWGRPSLCKDRLHFGLFISGHACLPSQASCTPGLITIGFTVGHRERLSPICRHTELSSGPFPLKGIRCRAAFAGFHPRNHRCIPPGPGDVRRKPSVW